MRVLGRRLVLLNLLGPLVISACMLSEAPPPLPSTLYEELLAFIPDTPDTRSSVYINDFELMREIFDVSSPQPGYDDLELLLYGRLLFGVDERKFPMYRKGGQSPWISGFNNWFRWGLRNFPALGLDVTNVDKSILAGNPDRPFEVVRGRFDPSTTQRALDECAECPSPRRDRHRNIPFYGWGEDYLMDPEKRFAAPAFDSAGRGGRISVQDGYVFRTLATGDMKTLIDASQRKVPTLAEVEEFHLLVSEMARLNAYSMLLSAETPSLYDILDGRPEKKALTKELLANHEDLRALLGRKQQPPLLRTYVAYAAGTGHDSIGAYMALVIFHPDSVSAARNVDLLLQRIQAAYTWVLPGAISERFLETLEVYSEGRVLTARLYDDIVADAWVDWILPVNFFLIHE